MRSATNIIIESEKKQSSGSRSKRLNQAIFLIAAIILLNGLLDHSIESRTSKKLQIGDSIPQFSLQLLSGKKVSEKDFLGKPTLYFFYAGWCPCSHQSVGWIKKAVEENKSNGLNVFYIGIQDSSDKLEEFAKTHKLTFPVAVNGGQTVASGIGVIITPTTLFVDEKGVIKSTFIGKIERSDQLENGLKSIFPSAANAA